MCIVVPAIYNRRHIMHRRTLIALAALAITFASSAAFSQSGEIRIGHIYSKTGPLEAYGKQTATGFMMGLDYATGGGVVQAHHKTGGGLFAVGFEWAGLAVDVADADFSGLTEGSA